MLKRLFILSWAMTMMACGVASQSWSADNGNGTYTNPLFYDEFSDPEEIQVSHVEMFHSAQRIIFARRIQRK